MALDHKTNIDPHSKIPQPGNEVWVEFGEPAEGLDIDVVKTWVLAAVSNHKGTVCVRFVDECEGRSLNGRFRNTFKATNVLAFPALQKGILGDIAVCVPTAVQEAFEQGKTLISHMAHLVVHGTLHLCGYDHNVEEDAKRMETRETEILHTLGYENPYKQHG